jgi:hypothetical protein
MIGAAWAFAASPIASRTTRTKREMMAPSVEELGQAVASEASHRLSEAI